MLALLLFNPKRYIKNFPQSQPLVKDCQFGVSPVNYSDSDIRPLCPNRLQKKYSVVHVKVHSGNLVYSGKGTHHQNSLLVKHQNDNTSAGLGRGRLVHVPRSHKGSEFRYAVVRL